MIQILTTGGTIGGLDYKDAKNKSNQTHLDIEDFFKAANVSFEYKIEKVFDKDSRFITNEDRNVLSEKIKSLTMNNILVTHGTFTMAESAKFIANLDLVKTIVFTGAFILGTEANTDAPFNLGFAVSVMEFLNNGVYIAMNGKIFDWNNVRKNLETNQFESLSQ